MFYKTELNTNKNTEFIDITAIVQKKVSQSEISDGITGTVLVSDLKT